MARREESSANSPYWEPHDPPCANGEPCDCPDCTCQVCGATLRYDGVAHQLYCPVELGRISRRTIPMSGCTELADVITNITPAEVEKAHLSEWNHWHPAEAARLIGCARADAGLCPVCAAKAPDPDHNPYICAGCSRLVTVHRRTTQVSIDANTGEDIDPWPATKPSASSS